MSDEIIEDFEEVEAVNSMSFKKRKLGRRSKNWTEDETDRFYEAITIVGNDFHAIASAFSRRSLAEGPVLLIFEILRFCNPPNGSMGRHRGVRI